MPAGSRTGRAAASELQFGAKSGSFNRVRLEKRDGQEGNFLYFIDVVRRQADGFTVIMV